MYNKLIQKVHHHFRIDAHHYVSGSFWGLIAQGITVVGGLLVTVLFTRMLSESDYGIYRYILGVAALLSVFSLTGIDQAVLQASAKKFRSFYSETLFLSFKFNLIISGLACMCALYYFLAGNSTLSSGLLLIAFFQPIINTFQFFQSNLIGNSLFKKAANAQSLKVAVTFCLSIIAILFTHNILILLLVFFSAASIANILAYYVFKPKQSPATPRDVLDKYILYAKHTSVRNIITEVSFRLDSILVFQFLGATNLAIYTIANLIPEQIKGTVKMFGILTIPKFSTHDTLQVTKNAIRRKIIPIFLVLTGISLLYVVFAPYLYTILFPKYLNSVIYSQIAILSLPATIGILPLTSLQVMLDEKKLYSLNLLVSIVSLTLTIALTITLGILGAIYARLATRYFNTFVAYYLLYKK